MINERKWYLQDDADAIYKYYITSMLALVSTDAVVSWFQGFPCMCNQFQFRELEQ